MIWGNVLMCSAVVGIAASFARTDAAGGDGDTGTTLSIALLCTIMFFFSVGAGPFTLVVVNEMIPYQARSKVVSVHCSLCTMDSAALGLGHQLFSSVHCSLCTVNSHTMASLFCGVAMLKASVFCNYPPHSLQLANHELCHTPPNGLKASVFCNRMTSGSVALTFLSLKDAMGAPHTFYMYGGLGFAVTLFYYVVLPEANGMSLEQAAAGKTKGNSSNSSKGENTPLLGNADV
jgi:hypothetical protein